MKDKNTRYTLPKRVLKRIIYRINKATTNETIRSAANRIAHLVGQYHAAPGTFAERANKFFLCREAIVDQETGQTLRESLGLSDYYFRQGVKLLAHIGFLRIVERFKPTRRADGSISCKPTEYAIAISFQPFFPAAHLQQHNVRQKGFSSMLSRVQEEVKKVIGPASRVHTGEGHKITHPGTKHHAVLGHDSGPVKGFDSHLDSVLASIRGARS